ncbi:ABC transporter permease [Ensifer sp. ENS06]|uniref:ABC transporter permease n=1 Tax=Ensifer sp. ENS06 TaxID=2769276 RepID=UPI00177C8415|nr:ABC transporter permease [Ensifer sp. ENS06]MBD9627086.1 ABC transporter permease [Ensifer sp. ENS06]
MKNQASGTIAAIVATLINVVAAFLIGALLIWAVGENPLKAFGVVWTGAFGSLKGISFTLYYATNFIFTGLAVAVAAHAREYNIGGEGQAYVSGLGVYLVGVALPFLPWPAALVVGIGAGMLFGATWAFVPAYMSARRGSNLVVTTIMFNFLASLVMIYLIVNLLRPPTSMIPSSAALPENLSLPRVDEILRAFGVNMHETPLNITFLVALIACAAVTYLIWYTRWGYELRAVGENRDAAAYAGVQVPRIIIQAVCLSGALAGMVGLNEVFGVQHRLILDFALGYGFTGVAVALIGNNHPLGIIPAAILFGALYQGGASMSFMFPKISREVVVVLQGLVILFAGGFVSVLKPYLSQMLDYLTARKTA